MNEIRSCDEGVPQCRERLYLHITDSVATPTDGATSDNSKTVTELTTGGVTSGTVTDAGASGGEMVRCGDEGCFYDGNGSTCTLPDSVGRSHVRER